MANIFINKSDIEKIDIVYVKGGLTASQVYKKYSPDYMMNLALYDPESGENITYLEDENIPSGYLFGDEGIGIEGAAGLVWTSKETAYSDPTIRDYVSGAPTLVKAGKPFVSWGNRKSEYIAGVHLRSFVGFNNNTVVLCSTDNKMGVDQLSQTAISLGCQFAINCDGGGSCHLQQGDKVLKRSLRKNASWLLIWKKKTASSPKYTVCLDPGHGAPTPGKRSPDGSLREYEFNRAVAKEMAGHLQRCGVKVLPTCEDDQDVSLNQRCSLANKAKADLFVSIHANAVGDGKGWIETATGWEAYICAKGGKAELLARSIQAESLPFLGLKDRGVKVANFQVLRDTKMPAVLVEHGFMTCRSDCNLLKTVDFRSKCALANAKGIVKHLGLQWLDPKADAPEPNNYRVLVQNRFGFDDNTMEYLQTYAFGNDLLKKLATNK